MSVVIFGGHPRDENELATRLAGCGPFDLRWQALEKNGREVSRLVAHALRTADAAIVITCRVSHEIMYSVKRYVQNHGLRYRAVVKATERQLRKTLAEMFPDWMIGQRYDINSHGRRKLIVRSVAVFSSTMICAPVNSVTGNWNASATRVM